MGTSTHRIIFHVDLDAFYVSVELRDNPNLRGEAVAVLSVDPKGPNTRGVVMTCSYEARKLGLKSGLPISRAHKIAPQVVYLPPNFALYEKVSEQVMETLRGFGDAFEQTGIDEAFLDVTTRVKGMREARELAAVLKRTVREVHGLTCSLGIGPNKSTAKIASDRQKPDGITEVPLDAPERFLAPLPVTVIPGVGKKTQAFLKERGVETISQLQEVPGKTLMQWFGKNGVWLWGVAHGEENIAVTPRDTPKSLSVERTFSEDVEDYSRVYSEARDAVRELIHRVKQGGFRYRVAGIKIRFKWFETHTREKTLTSYTQSEETLGEVTRELLKEFEVRGDAVRLVGVRVADLEKDSSAPEALDSWT